MSLEHSPNREDRRYLSERQAADYLGISDKTLQRHRGAGTGPQYIKCGGRVLYDIRDCDSWMESQKVQSTSAYAGIK
jgi:predicted DNA-binding transcriptional regulator AlpA